jgi:PAS domain S-box-containing protein
MTGTSGAPSECIEAGILENALVMIAVLDKKGKIFAWNHAAESITGYSKEEVIGNTNVWKSLYPDKDYRQSVTAKIAEILATKNYFENLETTIKTQSGDFRIILWNTKEILWDGELRVIAVGMDITRQKEMDAFGRSIIDNANVLMAVMAPHGEVLLWNKGAESITGYSSDEVVGNSTVWKRLYPDAEYRRTITRQITGIITEQRYFENLETTIITKTGEKRIISWNTKQIGSGGNYLAIAIGRDITEIAKAKREIKRNAEFQESVIINAKLWMTFLDTKNNVVIWNKAAEEITGYTRDEVVGHGNIWKWVYPDDGYRKEVTKKIIDIVSNKKFLENFETDIRTKSGERRRISWNTRELTGDDGERLGYIVVGNDITEQRKTEAFRESIINNANVLITVLDSQGKILVWNMAAETITGYSRNDVIGTRDVWKWLYPDADYRRNVTRQITSIITSRKYFENLETTIVTKSGEQRIILWNTRQIGSGGDYQAIAIGRDVTERKRAEEALLAYISEMAMRLKHPVEIIRDNIQEIADLINGGKLTKEEMVTMLEGQVRNATQIAANVQEFQKAITEKNKEIPEAYRKFLEE